MRAPHMRNGRVLLGQAPWHIPVLAHRYGGSTDEEDQLRRITAFAGLIATAALVAACGSESSSDTAVESTPAQSYPSFPPVAENASMTLNTNLGTIGIAMDPAAPITDASMAYLAAEGYFNGTNCHRLTTQGIFVLQCGDPEGTGRGGPGYEIPDENLPAAQANNYPKGTVAMANAGPNTNGSQFFIVYADTTLPPAYTIWGTVTEGLEIVEQVAAAGVAGGGADGPPAETVTIETATVE